MSKGVHYVYEHWRPDRDEPFYVGKGSGNRANEMKKSRNRHHIRIQSKLRRVGMCVEVRLVAEGLLEDVALAIEVERIASWRAAGLKLVNMNDGGEGGRNPNAEVRAKLSKVHKGKTLSASHRAAFSWAGRKHSTETLAKMSAAQKARFAATTAKERVRGPNLKPRPPEHCAKLSKAKAGRSWSQAQRDAIASSWTPERRVAQAKMTAERAQRMNVARTAKGRGRMKVVVE